VIFNYTATDKQGNETKGKLEAASRDEVVDRLHEQELIVMSVEDSVGMQLKKLGQLRIGNFALKERLIFTKQFVAMLEAGLPLVQTIEVLKEQAPNEAMAEQLVMVYKDLQNGMSLSKSFAKNSNIFNTLETNLMSAGEKSGNLTEVLGNIGSNMEKANKLKGKVKGALIYPAIISVAIVAVMAILIIFMVPQMENLYKDFGVTKLPFVTSVIVSISNFITSVIGIVSLIFFAILMFIIFGYYRSTESGKKIFHKLALKVPVFGPLNVKIQAADFARLLSMLLSSGVPIIDALNIVADSTSNVIYQDAVRLAATKVLKGIPLAVPLTQANIYPKILTRVIAIGEETGKLDQVLADMALFFESEVNETAENLTKLLEPIILLVVSLLVGFLAIAVYWPIYSIGQYIK
jgi:type IV pilus assembly protein PilC